MAGLRRNSIKSDSLQDHMCQMEVAQVIRVTMVVEKVAPRQRLAPKSLEGINRRTGRTDDGGKLWDEDRQDFVDNTPDTIEWCSAIHRGR
eukprot:CAMPEP_0170415752 /NCGR_PEP_ID=MMETSP0117_2-20130122/32776_1 /TAXON_ID=400756 /ORGANISM="Durinskia baltica, Strain CSIRO CS-38" /LENGTH=89 /DNA_ID=CAMNT_0010673743 /DNA_START=110 /DNA_END=375 /DNA_ORIENTATION=+